MSQAPSGKPQSLTQLGLQRFWPAPKKTKRIRAIPGGTARILFYWS